MKSACKLAVILGFLAIAALLIYVSFGFAHPDPLIVATDPRTKLWAAALRFGLPVIGLIVAVLTLFVAAGRIPLAGLALLFGAALFAGLLGYPFVSEFYYAKQLKIKTAGFHPYLQLEPPKLELRTPSTGGQKIFFLGGSTTAWPDSHKKDWPSRVEESLAAQKGKPYECYNQGKEWYTSLHSLVNYETNLRRHRPDVVVVMHNINDLLLNADFSNFSQGAFREDYGHFLGPISTLFQRVTLIGSFRKRFGDLWNHKPRTVEQPAAFQGLQPFKQNLNTIIDLATIDHAKVILMTEPFLYRSDSSEADRKLFTMVNVEAVGPDRQWAFETALAGMNAYNDAIREVAAARKTGLIDLEREIPKSNEFFIDDVHYTDKGYPLVSEAVTKGLARLLP